MRFDSNLIPSVTSYKCTIPRRYNEYVISCLLGPLGSTTLKNTFPKILLRAIVCLGQGKTHIVKHLGLFAMEMWLLHAVLVQYAEAPEGNTDH